MERTIEAYVSQVQGSRAGHLSETVKVSADYEEAGVMGNLTFDVPIEEAQKFHVGQRISIVVKW